MDDITEALIGSSSETNKSTSPKPQLNIGNHSAESILSFFAYFTLIVGILGSIGGGVMLINDNETAAGWYVLIGGPIFSLLCWATMLVLVNISNNIKEIKHNTQQKQK